MKKVCAVLYFSVLNLYYEKNTISRCCGVVLNDG